MPQVGGVQREAEKAVQVTITTDDREMRFNEDGKREKNKGNKQY